jgi:hypothetical protein
MHMVKNSTHYNMYIYKRENKLTIVLLYVDDLLLTGNNEAKVLRIKQELMMQFGMSDLEEVQTYLGTKIIRTKVGIWMHQRNYIFQILERFGMNQCNSTCIPMDLGIVLTKNIKSPLYCIETYRAIIEYLRWITTTRYDIKYTVGYYSRYAAESQVAHMLVAKCILRYLKKTIDYGILFPSNNLERFCQGSRHSSLNWKNHL